MNAIESAYWAGARDAATTIFRELERLHGRPRCKVAVRELLLAVDEAAAGEFGAMVGEILRGHDLGRAA